jgi:hypothetical protein
MKQTDALALKNRVRGDDPVVVVVTRRTSPASRQAVRIWDRVAAESGVEVLGADADAKEHQPFLDDAAVVAVPCALVFCRGVLLERRADVADVPFATELLQEALARAPRAS